MGFEPSISSSNMDVFYTQIMVMANQHQIPSRHIRTQNFYSASSKYIKLHPGTSSYNQVHQDASSYIKLQTSTSRCIQVHQATTKYIKAQLELQLTSKTSSSIEGHLKHPQKCDGVSRPNQCINRHLRHPTALRVILSIHINPFVHQDTTCASIVIQDIKLHQGSH